MPSVSANRIGYLFQTGQVPIPEPLIKEFLTRLESRVLARNIIGIVERRDVFLAISRVGEEFQLGTSTIQGIIDYLIKPENLPILSP